MPSFCHSRGKKEHEMSYCFTKHKCFSGKELRRHNCPNGVTSYLRILFQIVLRDVPVTVRKRDFSHAAGTSTYFDLVITSMRTWIRIIEHTKLTRLRLSSDVSFSILVLILHLDCFIESSLSLVVSKFFSPFSSLPF